MTEEVVLIQLQGFFQFGNFRFDGFFLGPA
jgi:hypothetical protein